VPVTLSPEDRAAFRETFVSDIANKKALDGCAAPAHDFEDATPERPVLKRWRCRACGGVISDVNHEWFEAGRRLGRSEPP
jgi:hypothetical protein